MKSPIISRKDSYIYKISKEIHKGTKITSNPLKKLTNHCVEHKMNMRNDEGCNPWSQLCNAQAPLCDSFFLLWCSSHFPLVYAISPTESWMNLPYLNKKIIKCTIYKTTRKKGSL